MEGGGPDRSVHMPDPEVGRLAVTQPKGAARAASRDSQSKYRLRLNDALTAANYAGPEYACGPRQPQETQSAPLSNSSEGAQPQRLWS